MGSSPTDPAFAPLAAMHLADEEESVRRLFPAAQLPGAERSKAVMRATRWIDEIRRTHKPQASVTDLLARFGLTSQEGLALMCLAEALLRIPDRATADALIRDKLGETHWNEALGAGTSWSINAAGWALSLTGALIDLDDPTRHSPGAALGRLISRLGQPVIREAIRHAMQWLADSFVMGETIDAALERAAPAMANGTRFSFDMLGEGARTATDSETYFTIYKQAIDRIGAFQKDKNYRRVSGISVKLSALHPRYEMAQRERVLAELTPRLVALCEAAATYNIPLTIDAEEAERLQLSLEVAAALLEKLPLSWQGLGFAVQAYQKRAPIVIDFLAALARRRNCRIHIRLVKGAYWDTEIKRAQERGLPDFPVFTRKASTDVSYHACARRLLAASDCINPVFGTHNALTVAHIAELAGDNDRIEFQRLHGMGDELHNLMQREGMGCCIYAPVGSHDVLLGYLVRRILENGANSSFVHRLLDREVPVAELVADPVDQVKACATLRHPAVLRAPDLYGTVRRNSSGIDLNDPFMTEPLLAAMAEANLSSPVAPRGTVDEMFATARRGYASWSLQPVGMRAACLEKLSDLVEQARPVLMQFLVKEAGKTIPDALGEVREAVDYCRYYAAQVRQDFAPLAFQGPTGENNSLRYKGRGVFVCISPWNFPLAIFLGQVAAALVAGNAVIAKPAPQTPQIAAYIHRLAMESGIPAEAFQLACGGSDIGASLIAHADVAGVAFTGSTATARVINRALAAKDSSIVPLIAETGGQNAMIVDGSALPEQVIDDVVTSAFRSTGQRCSAMRILCLPEATADKIITMLEGAMQELRIGDPAKLATDIGPVIDADAKQRLQQHIERLKQEAQLIAQTPFTESVNGHYVQPQAWEIPSIGWLTGEVFGPILHAVRYKPQDMQKLIAAINATGFGLTGGLHSRINATVETVERELRVGNLYVNRSIIGAVVGVQPFGGEGLSGTGPKAGGPNYLRRFALERVTSINTTAAGGNTSLLIEASR
jgi:RHH-type proline utilization regulon transcriptional repressor/proline dehydrogenase/delta 1-pyrroline-5-carboxylate dehydrogenase